MFKSPYIKAFQYLRREWFGQLMTGPQLMAHLAQIDTWLREYNIQIKEQ